MVHNKQPIATEELLEVTRKVLTGQIAREELARRPQELSKADHHSMLAYVGIALLLATRHKLDPANRILAPLSEVLYELTYKGSQADIGSDAPKDYRISDASLQKAASRLGLHKPGARGGHRRLTLSPPEPLQDLVEGNKGNPAVQKFLDDAAVGAERLRLRDEERRKKLEKERMCWDVLSAVRNIQKQHGPEGLRELLRQTQSALE